MSPAADRIAQFRKMTTDDPDNELGHFRLGQLLMEDGQYAEAVPSFERTLELSPEFSKVFQLLGETHFKAGDAAKAVEVLTKGYGVADARGDKMPRDAMGKLLLQYGGAIIPAAAAAPAEDLGPETGFKCARPMCSFGKRAQPLTEAPMAGPVGERIAATVCSGCWDAWKKDYSIKVINELRLDLSSESGAAEYDRHLKEFMGFDEESPAGGTLTLGVPKMAEPMATSCSTAAPPTSAGSRRRLRCSPAATRSSCGRRAASKPAPCSCDADDRFPASWDATAGGECCSEPLRRRTTGRFWPRPTELRPRVADRRRDRRAPACR